jgi:hypothetical protein
VHSNNNTVILDAADEVSISGGENFVQWSAGVAAATDTGTANVVIAASAQ